MSERPGRDAVSILSSAKEVRAVRASGRNGARRVTTRLDEVMVAGLDRRQPCPAALHCSCSMVQHPVGHHAVRAPGRGTVVRDASARPGYLLHMAASSSMNMAAWRASRRRGSRASTGGIEALRAHYGAGRHAERSGEGTIATP
jgi:hypothetical protein